MAKMLMVCGITILCSVLPRSARAQGWPPFLPLRYQEDYHFLKEDTVRTCYSTLKYWSAGSVVFSVGGEARLQYFKIKNEDWGETLESTDGYLLSRYLFHSDIHIGKRFRLFTQFQGGVADWKKQVSPVDENILDLHQLFMDYKQPFGRTSITLRIGRQELLYGAQRLISVREGPNYRQSFDGAKVIVSRHDAVVDLFYTHHVAVNTGKFNDQFSHERKLWGAYWTQQNLPQLQNLDVYYLGYKKQLALFEDVQGHETRHSIGSRIWGKRKNFAYDAEVVYQTGSVSNKQINAWTASGRMEYGFSNLNLSPEIGLKTELISGDWHKHDDRLGTFNAMFPTGGYFGLAALFGPANLFDIHPSLSLSLTKSITLNFDYDIFWRYSISDGLYTIQGTVIYESEGSVNRYIGDQLSLEIAYNPNRFIECSLEGKWFNTGDYLKDVGTGKDILYAKAEVQFTF